MRRLLRRALSRLHAERDRRARRRLGAAGEMLHWMALDVLAPAPRVRPLARALHPRFADARELRTDPAAFWMRPETVDHMLAGGDRCLVIRTERELLYRATVTGDRARVAEVLAPLGVTEPSWLVSGVLVHPAHRGRRLNAVAMAWLAEEARLSGARLLVASVAAWNRSSRRSFERAGFRRIGAAEGAEGSR